MTTEHDWEELFARHFHILNSHLSLCKSLQKQLPKKSERYLVAKECVDQTKFMMKQFQETTLTLNPRSHGRRSNTLKRKSFEDNETSNSKAVDSSEHKKRPKKTSEEKPLASSLATNGHIAPVTDASGLFTVDTNPSPIEAQNVEHREPAKRQHINGEEDDVRVAALGMSIPESTTRKRRKLGNSPREGSKTPDRRDSFERKVQQRLLEKEEQHQKKSQKKRKRESNGSIEGRSLNPDLANHLEPTLNPRKKRRLELKRQLREAKKTNPDITFDDVRKLNFRKNKKRTAQMGITNVAEAHEAHKEWEQQHVAKKQKKKS